MDDEMTLRLRDALFWAMEDGDGDPDETFRHSLRGFRSEGYTREYLRNHLQALARETGSWESDQAEEIVLEALTTFGQVQ